MTTAIEHAGFLAAIIEEPHDDFHRIVYADWLEEQGENERAEFIRDSVAARSLGDYLLATGGFLPRLGLSLPHWLVGHGGFIFHRGFVAEVYGLTFDQWREHGSRLVRQHPLELVKMARDMVCSTIGGYWQTKMEYLPWWLAGFYRSQRRPVIRHTREEAEKYLSDVLIWWAKAQELPQGEE